MSSEDSMVDGPIESWGTASIPCPVCDHAAVAILTVESVGTSAYDERLGHACTDYDPDKRLWRLHVHPEFPEEANPP